MKPEINRNHTFMTSNLTEKVRFRKAMPFAYVVPTPSASAIPLSSLTVNGWILVGQGSVPRRDVGLAAIIGCGRQPSVFGACGMFFLVS